MSEREREMFETALRETEKVREREREREWDRDRKQIIIKRELETEKKIQR